MCNAKKGPACGLFQLQTWKQQEVEANGRKQFSLSVDFLAISWFCLPQWNGSGVACLSARPAKAPGYLWEMCAAAIWQTRR